MAGLLDERVYHVIMIIRTDASNLMDGNRRSPNDQMLFTIIDFLCIGNSVERDAVDNASRGVVSNMIRQSVEA